MRPSKLILIVLISAFLVGGYYVLRSKNLDAQTIGPNSSTMPTVEDSGDAARTMESDVTDPASGVRASTTTTTAVTGPTTTTNAVPGALGTTSQAPLVSNQKYLDPLVATSTYLDGFHFENGNMANQMEAHHYCNQLNEEFTQCAIYDRNVNPARLVGIEYVISDRLFDKLPVEEKKLWHSHNYEVKSGQLIAPNLTAAQENDLMRKTVRTYGKTWNTWNTNMAQAGQTQTQTQNSGQPAPMTNFTAGRTLDVKDLPMGPPSLMMGFTRDNQLNASLVSQRDRSLGVTTADERLQRQSIPEPAVKVGANAWEKGDIVQLQVVSSTNTGMFNSPSQTTVKSGPQSSMARPSEQVVVPPASNQGIAPSQTNPGTSTPAVDSSGTTTPSGNENL